MHQVLSLHQVLDMGVAAFGRDFAQHFTMGQGNDTWLQKGYGRCVRFAGRTNWGICPATERGIGRTEGRMGRENFVVDEAKHVYLMQGGFAQKAELSWERFGGRRERTDVGKNQGLRIASTRCRILLPAKTTRVTPR